MARALDFICNIATNKRSLLSVGVKLPLLPTTTKKKKKKGRRHYKTCIGALHRNE